VDVFEQNLGYFLIAWMGRGCREFTNMYFDV